ncbi:hypothetical protein VRB95_11155 [Erwinia aphidicola]|jgi:uncharacterized membrane protein
MKVITRQAAALAGKTRFYTGKACRNGHDVERYVANGSCVECMSCHNSAHRARLGILIAKGREAAGVS